MSRFVVISLLLASLPCFVCVAQQQPAVTSTTPLTASAVAITSPVAPVAIAEDALMLLAQHQAAVGGVDLVALRATGTIAFPGSTAQLPADVVITGSTFLRVRISNSNRLTGFAAKGLLHKSYYADGTSAIDAVGTGPASVSAFQLLRTTDIVSKLLSLSKDSTSDAAGVKYDRLRARQALFVPSGKQASSPTNSVAVDYYFDPTTHYLLKSITTVQVPGILNPIPLETHYGDYRLVGTSLVPFTISQILNGQPDWVLTLTSITLPATLDSSLTAF